MSGIFISMALVCLMGWAQYAVAANSDVHHVLISGQSLSLGSVSGGPIAPEPNSNHLMFQGGISALHFNGLEPLRQIGEETIATGMAETVTNLIDDAGGGAHDMLLSLAGRGGTRIEYLDSAGGDPYQVFYRSNLAIWVGKYLLGLMGRSHQASAILWLQGESDAIEATSYESYLGRLQQLQLDYKVTIASLVGANPRMPLFTYQTNALRYEGNDPGAVALAQLHAGGNFPDIYTVTPIYQFDYSDALHLTNHGYRHLGGYFGKVYKQVVIDGMEWRPLSPVAAKQNGKTITVDFHVPSPPLVLDTTRVSNPGNFGFTLYDASGAVPIQTVRLAGEDKVEILAARNTSGDVEVRYAHDGDDIGDYWGMMGGFKGARGNLRDSDATHGFGLDASGQPYRLYNWSVVFRMGVIDEGGGQCGR